MNVRTFVSHSLTNSQKFAVLGKAHVRANLFKVLLALTVPLGGPILHASIYFVIAGWALRGPRYAIEALFLSWLITFLNPGIYSLSTSSDMLRWLVLAFAFLVVMDHAFVRRSPIPETLSWVVAFVFVAGVLSFYASYALDISLFKLASFLIATTTVLLGFHLTRSIADYWHTWLLSFFAAIVVLSFPLIFFDLGYVRNDQGFQGLLNHPQTYGAFIAPFLAWLLALCFSGSVRGILPWLLSGIAAVSLVATQSRTAALAATAGFTIPIIWFTLKGSGVPWASKRFLPWIILLLGLALSIVLLNVDWFTRSLEEFALKGGVGDYDIAEAFHHSRGRIIERSLENFREHPLTGIGFGIASDPSIFDVRRDPYFGLPIGASVEKGFAIAAVLEEVGMIGFVVFVAMILRLLRPAFNSDGGLPTASLAVGALFLNFGESVIFALGGTGLLVWLLLGAAGVMGISNTRCAN